MFTRHSNQIVNFTCLECSQTKRFTCECSWVFFFCENVRATVLRCECSVSCVRAIHLLPLVLTGNKKMSSGWQNNFLQKSVDRGLFKIIGDTHTGWNISFECVFGWNNPRNNDNLGRKRRRQRNFDCISMPRPFCKHHTSQSAVKVSEKWNEFCSQY